MPRGGSYERCRDAPSPQTDSVVNSDDPSSYPGRTTRPPYVVHGMIQCHSRTRVFLKLWGPLCEDHSPPVPPEAMTEVRFGPAIFAGVGTGLPSER